MVFKETINSKGQIIVTDAIVHNNQTFIVRGGFLRTATVKDEWREDVGNPEETIQMLKKAPLKIDIFRFWQRIPQTEPKFNYYKEWQQIAAIPIKDFKEWFERQISPKARNKIRKGQKLGVIVSEVQLTDDFIRGVMGIYNQSPVRRGKPFWHYGKDFNTVKRELSADLADSVFVGAYYQNELIGFIKFLVTDRYAMTLLILDKIAHRDKAPMNAMMAKVVEICAQRRIPYFTYTVWRRGEHGQFQESNGFERISVPEYFVPLTVMGRLALRLGLHKGIKNALPEQAIVRLLKLRAAWYDLRRRSLTIATSGRPAVSP